MITHKHIGIERVAVAVFVDGEKLDEFLIIGCVFEDILFLVPARDDMIERSLELYSRFARHAQQYQKRRMLSI
jgi:hypothetical protein